MRTEEHWKQCLNHKSYAMAQNAILELKDIAINSGYDPRGIKLHGKKEAMRRNIGRVGALITWEEGPEDWTEMCDLPYEVCDVIKGNMLVFYD